MSRPRRRREPIEAVIESALQPGWSVRDSACWNFVSDLDSAETPIAALVSSDPKRAIHLYETFIAGCNEKADEVDDSSGSFGGFAGRLYAGWIRARRAAGCDPKQTARLILDRMNDDPNCFLSSFDAFGIEAFDKDGLAAFALEVRARFDAEPKSNDNTSWESNRRQLARLLKAVYVRRRDAEGYRALCQETELTPDDCVTIADLLRSRRKLEEALAWLDRAIDLQRKAKYRWNSTRYDIAEKRRALLKKLGRGDEALSSAREEFQAAPCVVTYRELMRHVSSADRRAQHEWAMKVSESAPLHGAIELWLATREVGRLVARLQRTSHAKLEDQSHVALEPAAKRLSKSHPELAAKLHRALASRILKAKKSKYYTEALRHLEQAKRCWQRASLAQNWDSLVVDIRSAHRLKTAFMTGFEQLVDGRGPSDEPSFLERARRRWAP